MNKWEKEVAQAQLDSEKAVLRELEKEYQNALDNINEEIKRLDAIMLNMGQTGQIEGLGSKIYQKQHQQALQKQLEGILDKLHSDQFSTLDEYLRKCYTDRYIGTMYAINAQGIPIVSPIDQNAMVKAIQLDSKLGSGKTKGDVYTALGIGIDDMKENVRIEVSRGIASSLSYNDIARNIEMATKAPIANAKLIARTEGHRIQEASAQDARIRCKEQGADVVKQWDSALDGDTRPTHRKLDGQIRELDEPFEVDGKKAMFPGDFGVPAEDCNCRCTVLTRARWALDEDELQILRDRAKYFGLDKNDSFEEFRKKYLKLPENAEKVVVESDEVVKKRYESLQRSTKKLNGVMSETEYNEYLTLVSQNPEMSKFYGYADDLRQVEYRKGAGCFYSSGKLEFGYPEAQNVQNGMSKYHTVAHEYGHYFDTFARQTGKFDVSELTWNEMDAIKKGVGARYTSGMTEHYLSNSDQFLSALRMDMSNINVGMKVGNYCLQEGYKQITIGIQDAVDGWGMGRIWWGHGDKYYNRTYNKLAQLNNYGLFNDDPLKLLKSTYTSLGFDASNQAKVKKITRQYETASELWANMISAETTGGRELDTIMEKFPETYKAMKEIMKGIK